MKDFSKLSPAQRDLEAAKLEREILFEETRPLSPQSQKLWKLAKRGRGRPRKASDEKARKILISIEPHLLALISQFVAQHGLDRSKLFALSVQAFMASDFAHQQATGLKRSVKSRKAIRKPAKNRA